MPDLHTPAPDDVSAIPDDALRAMNEGSGAHFAYFDGPPSDAAGNAYARPGRDALVRELLSLREAARDARLAIDYTLEVLADRGWIPSSRAYRVCGAALAKIDALLPEHKEPPK